MWTTRRLKSLRLITVQSMPSSQPRAFISGFLYSVACTNSMAIRTHDIALRDLIKNCLKGVGATCSRVRNTKAFNASNMVEVHAYSGEGEQTVSAGLTFQRINQRPMFLTSLFSIPLDLSFQASIAIAAMLQDLGTAMFRGFISSQTFPALWAFMPAFQVFSQVLSLFWRWMFERHILVFYHGVKVNAF